MDEVESTAALVLLGQKEYVETLLTQGKLKEGEINVCVAIDEMIKDGEARGMERGMERGIEFGMERGMERGMASINELGQKLTVLGRLNDFLRSLNDAEYQRQLLEELGIGLS